jgi:hypothetical protein
MSENSSLPPTTPRVLQLRQSGRREANVSSPLKYATDGMDSEPQPPSENVNPNARQARTPARNLTTKSGIVLMFHYFRP